MDEPETIYPAHEPPDQNNPREALPTAQLAVINNYVALQKRHMPKAMYFVDANGPIEHTWLRNDKREFNTIPGMDSPYHSLQVGSAHSVFGWKQGARAI